MNNRNSGLLFLRYVNSGKDKKQKIIKLQAFLFLIILIVLNVSCSNKSNEKLFESVNFDKNLKILAIDYEQQKDTTLLQIIHYSGIRKSGYGLLLNLNSSFTPFQLDSLKYQLQIQDINAIHSFEVKSNDSVPNCIRIAIEGARFSWILWNGDSSKNLSLPNEIINSLRLSNANSGIVVIDNQYSEGLKQILSN